MSEQAGPACLYALVKQVHVDDVTKGSLTFTTRSSKNRPEQFTVSLTEILSVPPTDAPEAVPLEKGAVGNLYLSLDGWETASSSGNSIYQKGDPNLVLFKWPWCSEFRILHTTELVAEQLVVTYRDESDNPRTLDLIMDASVAPAQRITWNGAQPIVVAMKAGSPQRIWPEKITFTGCSKQKPKKATFDIIDVKYADFVQCLEWNDRKDGLSLKLSSPALALLHVTPIAIANLARGLRVTYPHRIIEECRFFDTVNDEEVKRDIANARANAKLSSVLPATTSKREPWKK